MHQQKTTLNNAEFQKNASRFALHRLTSFAINSINQSGLLNFALSSILSVALAQTIAYAGPDQDCYSAVMRGRQFVANNDLPNALTTFRTAQRIQPLDARPYFWIGYCLERTGDLNGAVKAYADCLDSAKMHSMDSAELRIDLGNTLCKLNYFKEAIFDYKRALIIDPSLTVAHLCLARSYIEIKDWQSATHELDFCAAHSIAVPELSYLRALTLSAQGAKGEALKQIEMFISSNQRTLQNSLLMQKAVALEAELKGQ